MNRTSEPPDPSLDRHYGTFEHPFNDDSIYSFPDSIVAHSMWHQLVWHPHSVGMTMIKTFFDWSSPGKMRRSQLVEVARKLERDIKTRLDAFRRSIPEGLRWGDHMTDGTLIHAAKLAASVSPIPPSLERRSGRR